MTLIQVVLMTSAVNININNRQSSSAWWPIGSGGRHGFMVSFVCFNERRSHRPRLVFRGRSLMFLLFILLFLRRTLCFYWVWLERTVYSFGSFIWAHRCYMSEGPMFQAQTFVDLLLMVHSGTIMEFRVRQVLLWWTVGRVSPIKVSILLLTFIVFDSSERLWPLTCEPLRCYIKGSFQVIRHSAETFAKRVARQSRFPPSALHVNVALQTLTLDKRRERTCWRSHRHLCPARLLGATFLRVSRGVSFYRFVFM